MRSSKAVLSSIRSVFVEASSVPKLFGQAFHVSCIVFFCVVVWAAPIQAAPQQPPASTAGPSTVEGVTVQMEGVRPSEFNGDLRSLPQVSAATVARQRPAPPVRRPPASNKTAGPPLARQQEQPSANIVLPLTSAPGPTQNFAGLSFSDLCGTPTPTTQCGGGIPPDPNGDVGPNDYIEAVNTAYAIYSKTGALRASFTEDQLWSASGSTSTPCGNGNAFGDPIVVYDPLADRWILAHFAFAISGATPIPPFYECIAVSKSSDPVAGGWWLYPLQMDPGGTGKPKMGVGNDYPKFGIWTDCLYMSANEFDFNQTSQPFVGTIYVSISRSDLESGTMPLTWSLGFINNPADPFTMIPSNLRGTPPPAGTPNYFVSESSTPSTFAFEVRKFTAGPNCGAGGTLSTPTNVSQTNYASNYASSPSPNVVVPQPNTSQLLDAIDDRIMQEVQYRRIGNSQSLWVVHNVGVSRGLVQPQWAQLDVTGGTIATTPVQQQIYAPDNSLNRWMGSIAADKMGNVALGYSTSNGTAPNFPSIAYSGRLATDPLNSLPQTETQLIAGLGSQTGTQRWGDYSGMSVDPSDDCTFWYVNEYYSSQANGDAGNWQTRIGSFKFPSCTASSVTFNPGSLAFNNQLVGTTSATTNVQITNSAATALSITSITLAGTDPTQFVLGAPSSGTPTCPLGNGSIPANSSCFLGVQFAPTSTGAKSADVSVADNASGSPQTINLSGTGALPAVMLSTSGLTFSGQAVGTKSATTNVQITNSGAVTLSITSITLTGTDSSQFTLVAPSSGSPVCSLGSNSILAGGSCFLGVQFTPTSTGPKSANVSVADNASSSPQTVSLSGTGTAPKATLNTTSLAFGSLSVGTKSTTNNVQLTNSGTDTLNITSITLTGTDSSQFAVGAPTSGSPACTVGASSLSAGNSCFFGVQFLPTSPGVKSASVSVTDNAMGSPQAVILSGTGLGPILTLSQATAAFGDVNLGLTSTTTNLQVTNSGNATLNVNSITLTGTDSSQFTVGPPSSGSPACSLGAGTINAGGSCFLGLQFKPTATGQRGASITVAVSAPATSQTTALSGVGVDFSIGAAPPTTVTVAAGTNASFTIDLTTTGGPSQNAIVFSASGTPTDTSVGFGPPSISSGTGPSSTPVTMTVATTRRSNVRPTSRPFRSPRAPGYLLYSLLCLSAGSMLWFLNAKWFKQRKLIRVFCLGGVLLACGAFQGCARTGVTGNNNNTPMGTPAGTSTLTVMATSGSLSRTTTVVLTVQ